MRTKQLTILERELELLKNHLMRSNLSDFNKQQLLEEIRTAKLVKDDRLPEDVVCIGSTVEIMDLENKKKFTFQLVLPSEANMNRNKVSVFAPIGIALLGYRVGAEVQWEMPNGLKTFEILTVVQKSPSKATN